MHGCAVVPFTTVVMLDWWCVPQTRTNTRFAGAVDWSP